MVISAIGLGVGLGLLYRSIQEPPLQPIEPAPDPTVIESPPSPLSTPESFDAAVKRDAQYLASMGIQNGVAFDPALARLPQVYANWYAALQNVYGGWGSPPFQRLYGVLERGTLSDGVSWEKMVQFRRGDLYRFTRFYRWENDRWNWVLPDSSFWKGMTVKLSTSDSGTIGPITIEHPIEDVAVIGPVFDRYTHAYQNLCESLKCPPPVDPERLWTPGLTLSITIRPMIMQPVVHERSGTVLIDLPSPRVVGYYDDANTPGDPYVAMAYATLIEPVVRLASGDYARWETDDGGELFLQAIVVWERTRLGEELQLLPLFFPATFPPPAVPQIVSWRPPVTTRQYYSDLLHDESLVPLISLWDWLEQGDRFGLLQHVAVNEAEAVVAFIAERYGEDHVVRFLNALGRAHALDEAIEAALPVSFGEFNRQWTKWIAGE